METRPIRKHLFFMYAATLSALIGIHGCDSNEPYSTTNKDTHDSSTEDSVEVHPVANWTRETTIGQIVAQQPQTARIFELVGIDYCCGGNTPLGKAAKENQIDQTRLLRALSVVGMPKADGDHRNWQTADLGELIDHVVNRHHTWLRRELPSLIETTNTVFNVHGDNHEELKEVAEIIERFQAVVLPHLDDEERRVFPAVRELIAGRPPADMADLLGEMQSDHDSLGQDLHRLRTLTKGFSEPPDACAKYREMLNGLKSLEDDMHTHVHLENNVLLPRALKLLN